MTKAIGKYFAFSDVDGTMWEERAMEVAAVTVDDIARAQAAGLEFIMCTGNPFFSYMSNLAMMLKTKYFIGSNGATVHEVQTNRALYTRKLHHFAVAKLLEIGNGLKLAATWWDDTQLYFNRNTPDKVKLFWEKRQGYNVNVCDSVETDMIKIIFNGIEQGQAKDIRYMANFASSLGLQVAQLSPLNVEVTASEVSKGHAIAWFIKEFNVKPDDYMVIGDSDNDRTMFEGALHSYAMGNATSALKSIARNQTGTVSENGLGMALKHFLEIKNRGRS